MLFSNLSNKYIDRDFLIVGGGPSAPLAFDCLRDDIIVIGVNEHALKLGIRTDYIVAADRIIDKLEPFENKPPIITPQGFGDYQLTDYWAPGSSGVLAAWCAFAMGAKQVILAGMDLYAPAADGTKQTYFWNPKEHNPANQWPLDHHLNRWIELVERRLPSINLRILGDGALSSRFPAYDPDEFVSVDRSSRIELIDITGAEVEFISNTMVTGTAYAIGEQVWLSNADANNMIAMGKAVRLASEAAA